ncbi:polyprenyl synthetase family protein [Patescibacteria group bacterium]|nr:polyprenyl synthetase family protein [Patescibacteria group bacterium]
MDFQRDVRAMKRIVDRALRVFFVQKTAEAKQVDSQCIRLVAAIEAFTLGGGKRMRPFLVWLGYMTQSNSVRSAAPARALPGELMSVMVGTELFHTFALIHDDIMDADLKRRGRPTVHAFFQAKSRAVGGVARIRFGESMGLLAGDLALVWADEQTGKTEHRGVLSLYRQMKQEIIFGQTLDILFADGDPSISKATIDTYKTAWYSVIRPLQMGAALAGASALTLAQLARFGLPVGQLFQLRDDVLDGEIPPDVGTNRSETLTRQALSALDAMRPSPLVRAYLRELVIFVWKRGK